MATRLLLKQLIQILAPAPIKDCFIRNEVEGYRSAETLGLRIDETVDENVVTETKSPMTVWSQRRNLVTLSVQLRGVKNAEVLNMFSGIVLS